MSNFLDEVERVERLHQDYDRRCSALRDSIQRLDAQRTEQTSVLQAIDSFISGATQSYGHIYADSYATVHVNEALSAHATELAAQRKAADKAAVKVQRKFLRDVQQSLRFFDNVWDEDPWGSAEKRISAAEKAVHSSPNAVRAALTKVKTTEDDIERCKHERAELERDLEAAEAEAAAATTAAAAARVRLDAMTADAEALQAEIDTRRAARDDVGLADLRSRLAAVDASLARVRDARGLVARELSAFAQPTAGAARQLPTALPPAQAQAPASAPAPPARPLPPVRRLPARAPRNADTAFSY